MCKISVIMPAYNVEAYIEKSIVSVLEQTIRDFELIIVDDGSEDKTLNLIFQMKQMDHRIHIIENQHGGVSRARYSGLVQARGEWIFFMDSDDLLAPWTFKHLLDSADDRVSICKIDGKEFSNEEEIDVAEPVQGCSEKITCSGLEMCIRLHNESVFTGGALLWGRLFRRELFKNPDIVILFSNQVMSEFPYNFMEDVMVGARLIALSEKVTEIKEVGYFHRINKNGLSHGRKISDYKYEQIRAGAYNLNFFCEKGWKKQFEAQLIPGYFLVMSLHYNACVSEKDSEKLNNCINDAREFDKRYRGYLRQLFIKYPFKIMNIYVWRYLPKFWLRLMRLYFH